MTAPVIHLASVRLVIGAVAASRWFANVRSDAVREQEARAIARRAMRAAYDAGLFAGGAMTGGVLIPPGCPPDLVEHLTQWLGKGIE